jgi:hypothetical protein
MSVLSVCCECAASTRTSGVLFAVPPLRGAAHPAQCSGDQFSPRCAESPPLNWPPPAPMWFSAWMELDDSRRAETMAAAMRRKAERARDGGVAREPRS